jgi:hypothetical protein
MVNLTSYLLSHFKTEIKIDPCFDYEKFFNREFIHNQGKHKYNIPLGGIELVPMSVYAASYIFPFIKPARYFNEMLILASIEKVKFVVKRHQDTVIAEFARNGT